MTNTYDKAYALDDYIEDEELDELSPEELQQLEAIATGEQTRKDRISEYVEAMKRPEDVIALTSDASETSKNAENTEGSPSDADGNGGATSDEAAKTGENTEGDKKEKMSIPIFDFLELDKVPDWYNQFLIWVSKNSHDHFARVKQLEEERKYIFSVVSTQTDLTPDQREFYIKRNAVVESLLEERAKGKASLMGSLDFPQHLKDKFGEAFKRWVESINWNITLTPFQMLLLLVVVSIIYSIVMVAMSQKDYRSV